MLNFSEGIFSFFFVVEPWKVTMPYTDKKKGAVVCVSGGAEYKLGQIDGRFGCGGTNVFICSRVFLLTVVVVCVVWFSYH